MFSTGSVRVRPDHVAATWKPMMLWMLTSRAWTEPRPINVFVVEHKDGLVLFDTGQDRASITDPDYFPAGITGAMYRRTAQADIPEDQTLTGQLAGLGYQPSDVSVAILSHLHQDHIGGLAELPNARIYVSQAEWDTVSEPRAELAGIMRNHIDLPGLSWTKVEPETTKDPSLQPFGQAHDLFGDGTLLLIPTPGHTPGSMSMIVRQPGRAPLAMVGDLTYALDLLDCGHVPGSGSRKQLQHTTNKMNELRRNLDGLVVLATHDPGAEDQLAKALEH
ncbi:MAG: N-acyl homoserine lactonase family protein [Candidatus Nanopelagicales bacterium]|nr:N-acyl homoserine lactonase family protein [Candidatus Nanopelagicales bacterium]